MRSLILDNALIIVIAAALVELLVGISVLAFRGRRKTYGAMRALIAILCFGLFYDAFIIAIGKLIGDGNILWVLSIVRYLLSAILIPLLFPISGYAADLGKKGMLVMKLLMVLFIVLGLTHTVMTEIKAVEFAGLLRYSPSDATPVWAKIISGIINLLSIIPLLVAGIRLVIKKHNIALLLSGICMLAFTVLAPATKNTDLMVFFSMIGEALMVFFMFVHAQTAKDPDFLLS
ncbi:MAG: hypothetical protein J6113_03885 [Lachnospiraceae bacterium]|nr:hypothetical protein [Lachnospiraceae bacterium]